MDDDYAVQFTRDGMVQVDLSVGNIAALRLFHEGRGIEPLYRAPWVDDPSVEMPSETPKAYRRLSGDTFCAPLCVSGASRDEDLGATANARWNLLPTESEDIRMELSEPVMGARVEKWLAAGPGPFLYQTHVLYGGSGQLPVTTHPMVPTAEGDSIFASPKQCVQKLGHGPDATVEGIDGEDGQKALSGVPASSSANGLDQFPAQAGCDDHVLAVERSTGGFGWTAVLRKDSIVFVMKHTKTLPVTHLWYANGGRTAPPWNGKFAQVLCVRDANLDAQNCGGGLQLSSTSVHRVRHAIGAIRRPDWMTEIQAIDLFGGTLVVRGDEGREIDLPFNPTFFLEVG